MNEYTHAPTTCIVHTLFHYTTRECFRVFTLASLTGLYCYSAEVRVGNLLQVRHANQIMERTGDRMPHTGLRFDAWVFDKWVLWVAENSEMSGRKLQIKTNMWSCMKPLQDVIASSLHVSYSSLFLR